MRSENNNFNFQLNKDASKNGKNHFLQAYAVEFYHLSNFLGLSVTSDGLLRSPCISDGSDDNDSLVLFCGDTNSQRGSVKQAR